MKYLPTLLLIAFLLAACAPAAPNANPNSPIAQQFGPLNVIAVSVAVVGGLVGFILSRRSNEPPPEPELPKKSGKKNKKSRKGK